MLCQLRVLLYPLLLKSIQYIMFRPHFHYLISIQFFDSEINIVIRCTHECLNSPIFLLFDVHHFNCGLKFLDLFGLSSRSQNYILLSGLFKIVCYSVQIVGSDLLSFVLVVRWSHFFSGTLKVVDILFYTVLYWIILRDQQFIFNVFCVH